MKKLLATSLAALAFAAAPGGAGAQPAAQDCASLRPDALAEARCELARGSYAAALLAAERALAFRRDDAEAAAIRSAALARLSEVRPAPLIDTGVTTSGWIGMQVGHDSNATAGNDLVQVTLPLFRNRDVTEELAALHEQPSPFAGINGGMRLNVPLSAVNRLRFGASGDIRLYTEAPVPSGYLLEAHDEHRGERFLGGVWVATDQRFLSRYHILDASTIGVHAGVPLRGTHELELFSVESDKRWPALELGTHESKAGVTLARASQLWRLTFFRGIERSMMRDPTFLDREFTGFGAEATWLAGPGVLRVSGQRVRNAYLQFSQLFLANRVDDFYEVQATYEYAIGSKWFLVPRAVWQQNRSNIAVVGFERRVWQIELRRDFY